MVSPSRRHAPAPRSRVSAASSSRVSFSGRAIATETTHRGNLLARAPSQQPAEADPERESAAEIHERAKQEGEREDASTEKRTRRKWAERVREAPHREAGSHSGRTLFRNGRGHQQRLLEGPREVREEAAKHEQQRRDGEHGREDDERETRAAREEREEDRARPTEAPLERW